MIHLSKRAPKIYAHTQPFTKIYFDRQTKNFSYTFIVVNSLVFSLFLFTLLSSCSRNKAKEPLCNSCSPVPYEFPPSGPYKPPTKEEEKASILRIQKQKDSLRHIDFRMGEFTTLLNYPYGYVPWIGRRGPGYLDPPIRRTEVDTIMRIATYDYFMGQVMTNWNSVTVLNKAIFRNVDFNCFANFNNVKFSKNCGFDSTRFNGKVQFRYFNGKESTIFSKIIFQSPFVVESAFFNELLFEKINCDSCKIILYSVTFNKAEFEDIQIDTLEISSDNGKQVILDRCHFSKLNLRGKIDTIMLSDVTFKADLDLTAIDDSFRSDNYKGLPLQRHQIYLHGVDVSKIDMDYTHFKLITRNYYGQELPANELRILYQGLLKNFKDRGRNESYELLDIEYRKYLDVSVFKWQSTLNEWWWNFGYDPIFVFKHILQFLAVFSLITFFFLESLQKKVYSLEAFCPKNDTPSDFFHSRMYEWKSLRKFFRRLWFSIAYSSVVFLLLSIKIEHLKLKSEGTLVLGTIFVVIMHITGLVCLGYVANFILQK